MNAPLAQHPAQAAVIAVVLAYLTSARAVLVEMLTVFLVDTIRAKVADGAFLSALAELNRVPGLNRGAVMHLAAILHAAHEHSTGPIAPAPARVFCARVSLLGHRPLGLCRVEEVTLAGSGYLRCTTLTTEHPVPHYITSASVYDLTEVGDDAAQVEVFDAEHARHQAKERAEKERAARDRRIAQMRDLRGRCVAVLAALDDGDVAVEPYLEGATADEPRAPSPSALTDDDEDLDDAIKAAGLDVGVSSWRVNGVRCGFRVWHQANAEGLTAANRIDDIFQAVLALGFRAVEVSLPAIPVTQAPSEVAELCEACGSLPCTTRADAVNPRLCDDCDNNYAIAIVGGA